MWKLIVSACFLFFLATAGQAQRNDSSTVRGTAPSKSAPKSSAPSSSAPASSAPSSSAPSKSAPSRSTPLPATQSAPKSPSMAPAAKQSDPAPAPTQSGSITPSLVPARTSGVAPLAVFFDASGTTATGTNHPFHELEYRWDFGDPASGNWRTTGLPKNKAMAPVAAHVFETPGTYTVTLTVFNGIDTVTATTSIVVADPGTVFSGTNTICVAVANRPVAGEGGCPAGADVRQSGNWPTIVNTFAAPGKRVLLNRGEVYTGDATALLNKRGPGIIGAYGSGAKPVIRTTATADYSMILRLRATADDWRLMDLDIDGQSDVHRSFLPSGGNYTASQFLLLRLDVHDLAGGIVFSVGAVTPVVPDQITLADSTIQRIKSEKNTGMVEASYWSGSRLAVLGNLIDDTTGGTAEHLIRVQYANRAVFSHNILRRSHQGKEMFALRAPCSAPCVEHRPISAFGTGDSAATKFVVISSNHIRTNTYVGVQAETGDPRSNGIIRDIIFERNWYQAEDVGPRATRGCIRMRAVRVTVRNEICDMTNAPGALGISVRGNAAEGATGSSDVWIYHNTFFSGGSQPNMTVVLLADTGIHNLSIRNNLAYGPNVSNTAMVNKGDVTGTFADDHNSIGRTFPLFASRSPAVATDYALRAGSHAINAGAAVPVFSDFFGVARPKGAAIDLGAIKYVP